MIRLRDLALVGGGLAVGLVLATRVTAAPIVAPAPPDAVPPAPVRAPYPAAAATGPGALGPGGLTVTRLSDNTLVEVRDEGDSQVVYVFNFDDNGAMKPVPQKARFYWKF